MNLFYHPALDPNQSRIVFSKEESRHIHKVLRKKEGDVIHTTDGQGHIVEARLQSITPKECIAIVEEVKTQARLPYELHMAVAPTKNNDRFEWFLEKATEIGVSSVTPIFCDRSERRVIKPERFEKIIESAMKQSLKAYKPQLNPAISFAEFIKSEHAEQLKFIAHCDDRPKEIFQRLVKPNEHVLVAIGPEIVPPEVIRDQDDNIGPRGKTRAARCQQQDQRH